MSGKSGHRAWGHIKKQRTKAPSYQASFIGPDPCQISGAMNTKAKENVKIPTTTELHAIADKLGTNENHARFKALVLLAGWCGCAMAKSQNCGAKTSTAIAQPFQSRGL